MDLTRRRYVLLPREGVRTCTGPAFEAFMGLPYARSTEEAREVPIREALQNAGVAYQGLAPSAPPIRIIDTTAQDGPKLVELHDEAADALNGRGSTLRAVPVIAYSQPQTGHDVVGSDGGATVRVTCLDLSKGVGISGVQVLAFTNFSARNGDRGVTDSSGNVDLRARAGVFDRIYAYPPAGYWGAFRESHPATGPITLPLTPVALSFVDCVRSYYGNSRFEASTGVRVGVVDTGIGPHDGINLAGGRNTVSGEAVDALEDVAAHGTHVAGLIGSAGSPPTGLRGLAPGVQVYAYRVFPKGGGAATNYSILKALVYAAQDGCDIINLSIINGPFDDIVREAIIDARNNGMLVIAATGNDFRKPVGYPAAYAGATAVTAMGLQGTFPPESLEEGDILRPPPSDLDSREFMAAFSNIGPQVAATAPGVGALSTLPGNSFGPLSGTSMAAPVVTGAAACLLSRDRVIFGMPRTAARSAVIERLLQSNCVRRQFGDVYEGYGMPDPARV